MKNFFVASAVFLLFISSVNAQRTDDQIPYNVNIFPPSPNASSLGKFGDIPVGTYTGIPSVNIPLYTINTGDLKLPISLDYHAGGIKVDESASNVGMGWALNGGGIITRTVRGIPDEIPFKGYLNNPYDMHNFPSLTDVEMKQLFIDINKNLIDLQSDLFTFNFAGYSGKFFIDKTTRKGVLLDNKTKLLIEGGPGIGPWVITDPAGNKYSFGASTNAVERTTTTQAGGRSEAFSMHSPTSWYLATAEDTKGNQITFNYSTYITAYCLANQETKFTFQLTTGPQPGEIFPAGDQKTWTDFEIDGRKLSSITWKEGVISFQYSSTARTDLNTTDNRLEFITVLNNSSPARQIMKYQLFHSYFGVVPTIAPYCSDGDNGRLRLDKVQQVGTDSNVLPPYQFDYNSSLPYRNSPAQDHWGFYNAANSNTTLVPEMLEQNPTGPPRILIGADRSPNATASQAGILKKIIYPTGGNTTFEYEGHTAYMADFSFEMSSSLPLIQYAEVRKSNMGGLPEDTDLFTVNGTQMAEGVAGAWCTITTRIIGSCDPSVREGGCGGEGYIDPVAGTTGSSWHYGEPGIMSGTITEKVFLRNGQYKLALEGFGPVQNIKIDYIIVAGPDFSQAGQDGRYNKKIGGIRIKKIDSYDALGKKKTTVYTYNQKDDPAKSSGVLVSIPGYTYIFRKESGNNELDYTFVCQYQARTATSKIPLGITQGSHIGYAYVEAIQVDEVNNINNGKTGYSYTTAIEFPDQNFPGFPFPPSTSKDMQRGLLKQMDEYKSAGSINTLIRSTINTYTFNESRLRQTQRGMFAGCNHVWNNGGCRYPFFRFYTDESIWTWKKEEQVREYITPVQFIEQKTNYTFDNPKHLLPTTIITRLSNAGEEKTVLRYPQDFADADLDNATLEMKNSRNMQSYVIQKIHLKTNTGSDKVTGSQIVKYVIGSNGKILPQENIILETDKPLNYSDPVEFPIYKPIAGYNAGKFSVDQRLLFDAQSNMVQNTTTAISKAVVWGYNNSLPIAEVTNANVKDVFYTGFEDADGNSAEADSKTGKKSRTGGYSKSVTGLSNIVYSLTYWQKTGSVWNYVTGNISVTTGSYTINLSGQIDDVRFYPATAQMTTYTYEPLLGVTSVCDIKNNISYYEYDNFSRLLRIRDIDKNIIKQYEYQYQAVAHSNPIWQATGITRCKPCPGNSSYATNILQQQEKDTNPQSESYNLLRWTDIGVSGSCVIAPDWQNTATPVRCKTVGGQNTGEQEQEQKDMNPCSVPANQIRWVVTGINLTACPVPLVQVVATNSTTKSVALQYTNQQTGVIYNFTANPGSSNVSLGTIPAGTYNVLMTPAGSTSTYPIVFNINGSIQTYYAIVLFGGVILNGTCTVQINPPPSIPIVATNSINTPVVLTFKNLATDISYNFTVNHGSTNLTVGSVPEGTYEVKMAPNTYNSSSPNVYKLYVYTQTYYATVLFGNQPVTGTCPISITK